MNLGRRIKNLRLKKNMSQEDLAIAINRTTSSVKKYEGGQTTLTFDMLEDIAEALGVKLSSIIFEDDDDLFRSFVERNNLHTLPKKELASLEIEFKFTLDYLCYKYDITK